MTEAHYRAFEQAGYDMRNFVMNKSEGTMTDDTTSKEDYARQRSGPDDGGPAFPRPLSVRPDNQAMALPQAGMSLRDWFAGQALAGFTAISSDPMLTAMEEEAARKGEVRVSETYSRLAYEFADAMIEARKR